MSLGQKKGDDYQDEKGGSEFIKTVLDCMSRIALNIWSVIPETVTDYLIKIIHNHEDEERLNNWQGRKKFMINISDKQKPNIRT